MKQIKKMISVLICALALLLCFACAPTPSVDSAVLLENEGTTVVIQATDTSGSLYDALKLFDDADIIEIEMKDGEYGYYIEELNDCTPTGNEFFAIYTTLGEYEGVSYSSSEFGSYKYKGKTLGSASYGVSFLPLVKGEIYIITISAY